MNELHLFFWDGKRERDKLAVAVVSAMGEKEKEGLACDERHYIHFKVRREREKLRVAVVSSTPIGCVCAVHCYYC